MMLILKISAYFAVCVCLGISCGPNNQKPKIPSGKKLPAQPENVPPKPDEDVPKPENVPPKKTEEDPLKSMKDQAEERIKDCENKIQDANIRVLALKEYVEKMKEPWFWQGKYFYENRLFALKAADKIFEQSMEFLDKYKEGIKKINLAEKLQAHVMELNQSCILYSYSIKDFIEWFMDHDNYNSKDENQGKEQSHKAKIEVEKQRK